MSMYTMLDKKLSCQEEAAVLRVTEYFAKSLKVTQGTIQKLRHSFLFVFHSNYDRIFGLFDTIHECDRQLDRQTDTA